MMWWSIQFLSPFPKYTTQRNNKFYIGYCDLHLRFIQGSTICIISVSSHTLIAMWTYYFQLSHIAHGACQPSLTFFMKYQGALKSRTAILVLGLSWPDFSFKEMWKAVMKILECKSTCSTSSVTVPYLFQSNQRKYLWPKYIQFNSNLFSIKI